MSILIRLARETHTHTVSPPVSHSGSHILSLTLHEKTCTNAEERRTARNALGLASPLARRSTQAPGCQRSSVTGFVTGYIAVAGTHLGEPVWSRTEWAGPFTVWPHESHAMWRDAWLFSTNDEKETTNTNCLVGSTRWHKHYWYKEGREIFLPPLRLTIAGNNDCYEEVTCTDVWRKASQWKGNHIDCLREQNTCFFP